MTLGPKAFKAVKAEKDKIKTVVVHSNVKIHRNLDSQFNQLIQKYEKPPVKKPVQKLRVTEKLTTQSELEARVTEYVNEKMGKKAINPPTQQPTTQQQTASTSTTLLPLPPTTPTFSDEEDENNIMQLSPDSLKNMDFSDTSGNSSNGPAEVLAKKPRTETNGEPTTEQETNEESVPKETKEESSQEAKEEPGTKSFIKPKKITSFSQLERLSRRLFQAPTTTSNKFAAIAPNETAQAIREKVAETLTKPNNPKPSTSAGTKQANSANSSDEDEDSDNETTKNKRPKPETPPPIVLPFVPANHREVDALVKPHLKLGYRIKYAKNTTIIYPKDMKEYYKLKEFLKNEGDSFYTYGTREDKRHAYIIRGLDAGFGIDEIRKELTEVHEIVVEEMFKLRNTYRPLYMVTVSPNVTIQWLNEHARHILNTRIYWERRRNERRITQCHRCQGWGHATKHCFKPFNCLKCAGPHPTRECTKEKESPAKCVNCQGDHPANSVLCPVYIFREKNLPPKSKENTKTSQKYSQAPAPTTNYWEERKKAATANTATTSQLQRQQSSEPANTNTNRYKSQQPHNTFNNIVSELGSLQNHVNMGEMLRALKDLNAILANAQNKQDRFYAFLDFALNNVNNYNV